MVRLVQTRDVNSSSKHTFMTASESLELRGSENSNTQVLLESLGQRSWLAEFNVSLNFALQDMVWTSILQNVFANISVTEPRFNVWMRNLSVNYDTVIGWALQNKG